jgi:lipopolysaccharide transport system permease protein
MFVGTTVDSGRPVRLLGLLSPLGLVRSLWAHRELVRTLTAREVSGRYRGSALGGLWSFIQPLCMLAIYTFVFSVVLPAKWGADVTTSTGAFARTLFAGLILYSVFSETLAGSASVVIANPSYVKRVVFPLELLPMTKLGAALVHLFIGLGMLLVATVATTHSLPMTVVYFPLVLLPLVMLTAGRRWA